MVIDMIKGFLQEGTGGGKCSLFIPGAHGIISNINREINSLKEDDLLIFVCDEHGPDDKEFSMFPVHCVKGSEECEMADGFVDRPHKRIPKTRFSAFYRTGLDDILGGCDHIEEIVVTGVCTDICILATALDARYRDHKVAIPKDCVHPLDRQRGESMLRYLAEVVGVEVR